MFSQFRLMYPEGSLISELLTIQHGKYIVRVLVEVNGKILSSGLAACDTLEQAEDSARIRALNTLELNSSPVVSSPVILTSEALQTPLPLETTPLDSTPSELSDHHPANSPVTLVSQPLTPPPIETVTEDELSPPPEKSKKTKKTQKNEAIKENNFIPEPKKTNEVFKENNFTPEPKKTEEIPPITEMPQLAIAPPEPEEPESSADLSLFEDESVNSAEFPGESELTESLLEELQEEYQDNNVIEFPAKVEENAEKAEEIPSSYPSLENLDYSEIIARSNAEMKRLGWTNEQGRDYLLKTYGKKSRQLLSDPELLEFLGYLESLPS